MYRLWPHPVIAKFYSKSCCSSLLCTATNIKYPKKTEKGKRTVGVSKDAEVSFGKIDLQTRVLQWDEKLPIPDPPPLRSLVDHLMRRRSLSCSTGFKVGLNNLLVRSACRVLGLQDAHERHFRFGGMTFMDGSMADMKQFIEKAHRSQHNVQKMTKQERVMLKALLKKAIESYKDEVVRYKKGEINLWQLDALYRNMGLANRLPFRKTPQLKLKRKFTQAVVDFLRSPLLNVLPPQIAENVTSNPCWYPEIEAIGRPGVKCILPPTSMALHYMFGRDAISITVNANPKHPCYKNEEEFVKVLEQCLQFVKDLLDAE